jgi:hypothetical protein
MKFEIKQTAPPKNGDIRDVLKFAWLPVVVSHPYSGRMFRIWLEKYHEQQIYSEGSCLEDSWSEWQVKSRWIG